MPARLKGFTMRRMSIRNLDSLFDPASIVVCGASLRPGSVGATVWHNLSSGNFKGPLYAVNPKHRELAGHPVQARVADLPTVQFFDRALLQAQCPAAHAFVQGELP